jgi:hypothetical protein
VDATLNAARIVLPGAAAQIDAAPNVQDELLARRVRATVEGAATIVLDRMVRALGAGPLCLDARHAHRVADLAVYIRQSYAEADLAELGEKVTRTDPGW